MPTSPRAWRALLTLCLVLATSACSTLPTIVPDLARTSDRVQMDGANGPLSRARAEAVLARLQAGGKPTSIFDRHLAFEEAVAGTPSPSSPEEFHNTLKSEMTKWASVIKQAGIKLE